MIRARIASALAALALFSTFVVVPAVAAPHSPDDVIGQLIEDGVSVLVTGSILEMADAPAGVPRLILETSGGQDIRLEESAQTAELISGEDVKATVALSGEVVGLLTPAEQADLAQILDAAKDSLPIIPMANQVAQAVLEAADSSDSQAVISNVQVTSKASAVSSTLTAGEPHTFDIVLMAKDKSKVLRADRLATYVSHLKDYWVRETRGLISDFVFDPDKVKVIESSVQCDNNLWDIADRGAREFGVPRSIYTNRASRRHLLIVSPTEERGSGCEEEYSGVATFSSSSNQTGNGGLIHVIVPSAYDGSSLGYDKIVAHELGHNFGLDHAGAGTCPEGVNDGVFIGTRPVPPGACAIENADEVYGDRLNIMGAGVNGPMMPLNGKQKHHLGVIQEGATAGLVKLQGNSSSGTYTIAEASTTSTTTPQSLLVIHENGSSKRAYLVDYNHFSGAGGGLAIRRLVIEDDSTIKDAEVDSIILYPTGVTSCPWRANNCQLWGAGKTFTAASGELSITLVSGDETSAVVKVDLEETYLHLSTDIVNVSADGGNQTVSVYSGAGTWNVEATSVPSWISVTSKGTSGVLSFSVDPYYVDAHRFATIVILVDARKETLMVDQSGRPISISGFRLSPLVKVGTVVHANFDSVWPSDASLTYTWRVDGKAVWAGSSEYVPTTDDCGKVLSVELLAEKSGYSTRTNPLTAIVDFGDADPGAGSSSDDGGGSGVGDAKPGVGQNSGGSQTEENIDDQMPVDVAAKVLSLKSSTTTIYLKKGKTAKVSFVAYPLTTNGNASLAWVSSAKKVATITSTGSTAAKAGKGTSQIVLGAKSVLSVKALKKGKSTITLTSSNGKRLRLKLVVVAKTKGAKSVKITTKTKKIAIGKALTLKAKVGPNKATYNPITWKSSNNSVATVDAVGTVVAKKKGKVTISVMVKGKKHSKKISIT